MTGRHRPVARGIPNFNAHLATADNWILGCWWLPSAWRRFRRLTETNPLGNENASRSCSSWWFSLWLYYLGKHLLLLIIDNIIEPSIILVLFLFLVLYPLLVLPHHPPTHTRSLTHSLPHSFTDSLTHPPTHSLHSLNSHSLTHSLPHSLAHSLTHSLTHVQGVGCTPWRPLVSAALPVAFAWQVRHLVLCKGSDVRPGVPWSPPLCRWLLCGRCGTWCSARGRMYALASLGLRRSAGGFCVAGAALGALQGVGCTPWRPLVSAGLPVAFAWQVRHLVLCTGVGCTPWRPLGLRRSAITTTQPHITRKSDHLTHTHTYTYV